MGRSPKERENVVCLMTRLECAQYVVLEGGICRKRLRRDDPWSQASDPSWISYPVTHFTLPSLWT